VADELNPKPVEPPKGFHQGRVDEKGRLKLPAVFQQYLAGLGEKKLFITTFDLRTARIYTSAAWRDNENLLENAGDDAESADLLRFMVNHYGAESEMDPQGRLLVPKELRTDMSIENQPVWLGYRKDGLDIFGEAIYHEQLAAAKAKAADALNALKKKGLKA
jgi:MraZ protein